MIENIIRKDGNLTKLISYATNKTMSVFGCGIEERLAIIDSLDSFVMYITNTLDDAREMCDRLNAMGRNSKVFYADFNYGLNTFYSYTKLNEILNDIAHEKINTLVLPVASLTAKLPSFENYLSSIKIEKSHHYNIKEIIKDLLKNQYKKVEQVENVCEFRSFGDILEIYGLNTELPVRINFFDDEVESIYSFDENYNKVNSYDEIEFLSNSFSIEPNYSEIEKTAKAYLTKCKTNEDIDNVNEILNMIAHKEINPWSHIFSEVNSSIFDYLPNYSTIIIDDTKVLYDTLTSEINGLNEFIKNEIKQFRMFDKHEKSFLNINDILSLLHNQSSMIAFQQITSANKFFSPQMVFNLKSIPVGNYINKHAVLINDLSGYITTKNTVLLFVKNKDYVESYTQLLDSNRLNYVVTKNTFNIIKNTINIIPQSYLASFGFREENLVVIGSNRLFGLKKISKVVSFNTEDNYLPQPNDYVVHEIHGVGKYLGTQSLNVNHSKKDYLIIEYKNNDKLYLPVEYTNRLTKFIGTKEKPTLNKLGGVEFLAVKNKVKNSLKTLAFNLVELYKKRENTKGYVYKKELELEQLFKDSFPYTETVDQDKAILDVYQDMENGKVMDRLICGDVGYGKTEVAMRAIFKTIIHGKQAMFMCPTTILSQQHYNTCVARLKDFGVRVEVLNRFKTKSEVNKIVENIKLGDVDVVCGTHRLLSKDVQFKDLGLLVLDEEQKFGVGDKEKIKNLKNSVNVLTLSATPIPRTLHLSLIGARDISVINTPPNDRLNVATIVTDYNEDLLKNAIQREIDRNGQVLVVYNKVEDIYSISSKISTLFEGKISVDVAHGQMPQETLENAIYRLYSGQTQVLVATTLIENGVDLPNANTLFVLNADSLGLSQMYQLKGRVGRSNIQAYAYFTFEKNKIFNEDAYKRLQAILEYSEMGSGYKIAMRDLEIRGAGNILGPEQHGHMQKVGYAMYVNLLNQAVEEVKQNKSIIFNEDARIESDIDASISDDYILNSKSKIELYNEISRLNTLQELLLLNQKLVELFKEVSVDLQNLMKIALIKNLATKQNILKVVLNRSKSFIQFKNEKDLITNKVNEAVDTYKNYVVINLSNLPIIEINQIPYDKLLDFVIEFLSFLL